MAKKQTVHVNVDFVHEYQEGALVVDGKEIDPPRIRRTEYKAGERITFHNKEAAVGFCKAHGFDKVWYMGRI